MLDFDLVGKIFVDFQTIPAAYETDAPLPQRLFEN
jgi:hypothetical protein